MKKLKPILILLFVLFTSLNAIGQSLTYTFIDPCTKDVTYFSIPIQNGAGTTIFFLGRQRYFTAGDLASGVFASWVNQTYSDYRKISPCGVQQARVTQNQITSQIIGSTIQSVVGSIMSQAKSESNSSTDGGIVSEDNKKSKNGKNSSGSNTTSNNSGGNGSNNTGEGNQTNSNSNTTTSSSSNTNNSGSNSTGNGQGNTQTGGGSNSSSTQGGGQTVSQGSENNTTKTEGSEVVGITTMTTDTKNDRGAESSGGSKGGKNGGRSNPVIISSDLTNAQNLDRSYTGIINVGMSQSSMTGTSSWGVNSMIWFDFNQFALTGRYTKIQYNKTRKIKLIHNINLTGVYSYGNILGFLGYSTILNAGKWGITGINVSAAATKTPDDDNLFMSPSATAFYTKPFKVGKRMILSPELYIISTPLIYSSVDKVTISDRTFSAFIGTGVDYQISKKFKINVNYKLNTSTNPDFPILSFFLIGSKINL